MTHLNSRTENSSGNEPISPKSGNALRYGLALPFAAAATVALTISMGALIRAEFTPQDKAETASFEINPRVDDILDPVRTEEPDALREVKTPPPPPTTGFVQTAAVKLPIIEVVDKRDDFKMETLIFEDTLNVSIDKPPTPLVRIPPIFPNRFLQGEFSGYCKVQFDISPEGRPFNVQTTSCTNAQLKSATVKSVQRWRYAPETRDGRPVTRLGMETTIRFDLTGDRGEILPLPSGY